MTAATAEITHAGSVSRILNNKTNLKKSNPGYRNGGYEVVQRHPRAEIWWTQTPGVPTTAEAFRVVRAALSPQGYSVEQDKDTPSCFLVLKTESVNPADVRRALRGSGRVFECDRTGSGFVVALCPTDHRFAKVTFGEVGHTSYQGDREQMIRSTLGVYADVLEKAGYGVRVMKNELSVLVGIKGSRRFPATATPKPTAEGLQVLRDMLEFELLDVYTRLTPGKHSIFVLWMPLGGAPRRLEVFYDEETGRYRAMPWMGGFFGSVHTQDLGKVLDFVRTEIEG